MENELFMEQGGEAAVAIFAGFYMIVMVISLILSVVTLIATWKLFTKAGHEGWKCLIPIYSAYILYEIIYGQGWKFLLCFVPILNYAVAFMTYIRMAQVYGKGIGFGILNLFFYPITMCILAFGDSYYEGPVDSFL